MADALELQNRLPRLRHAAERLPEADDRGFGQEPFDLCGLEPVERLREQAMGDRPAQQHRRDGGRSAGEPKAREHRHSFVERIGGEKKGGLTVERLRFECNTVENMTRPATSTGLLWRK